MKKIYSLAIVVLVFTFSTNAQIIQDDFEGYSLGPMASQNTLVWRTWSAGHLPAESITVVDTQAYSGSQSGYIGAGQGPQDAVLDLGNVTSGDYTLVWRMYIPSGKTGYFNIQGTLPAGTIDGVFNSSDIYFNETGATPGMGIDYSDDSEFSFPEDTWFQVSIYFDVDAATYQMSVNGTVVNTTPVSFQTDNTLGGIDFFAVSANNEYWIDDVIFGEGVILSTESFDNASFSVYPNPVVDNLNIQSNDIVSNVSIYNVLGKLVYQAAPNTVSPSINLSTVKSGIYFVEVTIGNSTKTVKVIK